MPQATAHRPVPVSGESTRRIVTVAIILVVVALVAMMLINPVQGPVGVETPSAAQTLTRAQQAEADRLTGLAEYTTFRQLIRSRDADAARWQAIGDHYNRERARQAETDRLTGLAGHYGVNDG